MVGPQKDILSIDLVNQAIEGLGDKHSFVFIKDVHHSYVGCNHIYAHFLGLEDHHKIIGLTDSIINPQQAELYRLDDEKVLRGEEININNPAFFKDIGSVQVTGKMIPLKNLNNDIIGILGTTKLMLSIASKPFYQAMNLLNANTIPLIVNKKFYQINTVQGEVRISKREVECILFLFKCMTSDAIAHCLQLSQRSVESYFVNIKNKLNVKHKNEIIEAVIKGGLLQQL